MRNYEQELAELENDFKNGNLHKEIYETKKREIIFLVNNPPDETGAIINTEVRNKVIDNQINIEKIVRRYREAYEIALAIKSHGQFVKSMGVVFGSILAFIGVLIGLTLGYEYQDIKTGIIIASIVVSAFIIYLSWIRGTLIMAQGENVLASLDTAVHTSPFLTNEEKAIAMSMN